jgi:hypothetical protein
MAGNELMLFVLSHVCRISGRSGSTVYKSQLHPYIHEYIFIYRIPFIVPILTNSSVQRLILRRPEQPLRPRLRLSPLLNTQAQYTIDDPRKMRRIGAIIAFRGELEQCTGWRGELGG